jgi:hypothetical protein
MANWQNVITLLIFSPIPCEPPRSLLFWYGKTSLIATLAYLLTHLAKVFEQGGMQEYCLFVLYGTPLCLTSVYVLEQAG